MTTTGGLSLAALLAVAALLPGPGAFAQTAEPKAAVTSPSKAKPASKKRPRIVVRGRVSPYGPYGFLPGYVPPDLRNDRPAKTYHYWYGRTWYGYPIGSWGTGGYGGGWYRGHFSNGLGPCWTRTPIGPMWNCG